MGRITIEIAGSFGPSVTKSFSALEHGHADCVGQAIEYLVKDVQPGAIRLDHKLHTQGNLPSKEFGRGFGGGIRDTGLKPHE